MKNFFYVTLLFAFFQTQAQSVFGKWKTIDDKTNQAKSIIEIYENSGKVHGKIIDIIDPAKRNFNCINCTGSDKNKPLIGLVIIKDLKKDGLEYNNGKIIDPESGKVYKSYIKLIGKDKLEVRGYVGIALIGRSQTWIRVK